MLPPIDSSVATSPHEFEALRIGIVRRILEHIADPVHDWQACRHCYLPKLLHPITNWVPSRALTDNRPSTVDPVALGATTDV